MSPADETPRASRRERPAKPALTRQGVIDAALAILRDDGLHKVTMRRVAAVLDTGHASLYVYVRNTEDLHAQILDALLGELSPPGAGTWRDRVKELLTNYQRLLFRYPEIARMALSTQPTGPHYLALVESVLALLDEGGATVRAAAWGVDLLLLYPTAVAVEHTTPERSDPSPKAMTALLDTVDPARFPHLARIGAELMSGDGPARSDWALDVLLDGILAAGSPARHD